MEAKLLTTGVQTGHNVEVICRHKCRNTDLLSAIAATSMQIPTRSTIEIRPTIPQENRTSEAIKACVVYHHGFGKIS